MATRNKGYDLWLEEQKRKEEQAAAGIVTTTTSPVVRQGVRYEQADYTGDSKSDKTYKWEKDILADLPKKKYGNSYNDKFKSFAAENGLSESEAVEFRRWLDSKEDGVKSKNSEIDAILAGMSRTASERWNRQYQPTEEPKEEKDNSILGKVKSGALKALEIIDRPGDAVRTGIKGMMEGEGFLQNAKYGFFGDKDTHGTELNEVLGFNPEESKVDKAISRLIGKKAIDSLPLGEFVSPFLSQNVREKTGKEVAGMGTEVALDPLNLVGAGFGVDDGLKFTAKTLMKNLDNVTSDVIGTKYAEEIEKVITQDLKAGMSPDDIMKKYGGDPKNVIAPQPKSVQNPQAVLDEMLGQTPNVTPPKVEAPTPEAIIEEITKPVNPAFLDEWVDFAQQPSKMPKSRPMGPIDPVEEALKQRPIGYYKDLYDNVAQSDGAGLFDNELASLQEQVKMMDDAMLSERERVIEQYMADRKNAALANGQRDLSPDEFRALQEQAGALETKLASQGEVNPFTDPEFQKLIEPLNKYDAAASEWEATKELALRDAHFKNTYGKIIVPEGNWADWGSQVPARYRAKRGETQGMDLYAVADAEGKSVDELVQEMQNITVASKSRKKDFITDGLKWLDNNELYANRLKQIEELKAKIEADAVVNPADITRLDEMIKQLENPKAPDMTAQWKQEAEDLFLNSNFYKENNAVLDAIQQDIKAHSNPSKEMIYKRLKQEGDPEDFNKLVDLYLRDLDAFEQTRFRESLIADPRIKEGIQALTPPKRAAQAVEPPTVPTAEPTTNPLDSLMDRLKPQPKPSIDEVLRSLKGETTTPPSQTPKTENPDLLRLNLQAFNETELNPMVNVGEAKETVTAIENVKNPFVRFKDKFYQEYVNRSHNFTVAHKQLLDNQIAKAKEVGDTDAVARLEQELKDVKKFGSEADKALQIEGAASNRTLDFLENHFSNLSKSLGDGANDKTMAEATQWLMAKNLQWLRDSGRLSDDHQLVKGWDWERVTQEVAVGDQNPAFKKFAESFKGMTQSLLDERQLYGLIDDESHVALSENPFYIPMERDFTYLKDNIDRSLKTGSNSNRRSIDNYELHHLGEGDIRAFYKNPLETISSAAHTVFRNTVKNDTGEQLYKLAQLDDSGMFVKEVSKAELDKNPNNIYEFFQNGEKKYLRLQDDLMQTIKENDEAAQLGNLGKLTQLFARLKTSSLEYQTAAVPRDLATNYLTSQAGPIEFFAEAFKAATSKNKSAKQVGAYFKKAYSDTTGGIDPNEVTKQFAATNPNFHVADNKNTLKKLGRMMVKIAKLPFKPGQMVGQFTDELPRAIEVNMVGKKFQPQLDAIDNEIQALQSKINDVPESAGDFSDATAGIDDVKGQLAQLNAQKRQIMRDMKREQTYRGLDVINYARGGSGKFAKWIRQHVIFANTTTQSKDKMIRAFMENPVKFTTKAALIAAPFVTAQQLAHNAMSDDDREIYDNLPPYMKTNNYLFVQDGEVVALPKVHELALLSNPIEATLKGEPLDDSARMAVRELLPYQTGMLAQGLVPNEDGKRSFNNVQMPSMLISPGVDLLANKKVGFNNKPVSNSAKWDEPEDYKANSYTLEAFKNAFGDTPTADRWEYGVRQYGGDAGKYSAYGLDALLDSSNEAKIDELLRNLNPLQDRLYRQDSRFFKSPPQETKKK